MAVKCPKCQTNNPETAKFCGECGTQLFPVEGPTLTLETQAKELTRGTIFAGRYEILEALGTGGMGKVYRVYDRKLEEEVALKLIKPEIAANRKAIGRFKNELKVARKIAHKSVSKMYDLGESEGASYITMEYVAGQDLKGLIRQAGQLTVTTSVSLCRQVAEGLSEAHRLGIIHRDLKPGNIMIDKEGSAKIMDFGIARSLLGKGLTGEGAIIGTPEYMSPEQVEGKEADQRSDIYALGVILFEMIVGRPPFEGETPLSIAIKHRNEPPPIPKRLVPQIPDALNRLILCCLEKEKAKRYQTAEELISDLAAVEESLPTAERIAPKRKTISHREITVKLQPRRLIIPGAALVVITAVALLFMPSLLRKKTRVAPKIENSIAVISFENLTGSSAYNDLIKAVPSLFITKFESMGFSYVATLERLQDLLKQMGKDPWAPIDTGTGFAACQREGIGALMVGRITKAGNVFAIDIKVLDVDTKKALASASSRGEGEGSILMTQVDDLAEQITQRLGWTVQKTGVTQPVSEVTTSSMEAYSYYLKGQEAHDRFYFVEAHQYFLRAVEIDPGFAMAYRGVARACTQIGLPTEAQEAAQKAMSLADRTTPKEKLYIQATHASIVEGNKEKYIQIYKRLVEKFPKEKEAHLFLGAGFVSAYNMGRALEDRQGQNLLDEAIKEYQAALDLDPNYRGVLNNITGAYIIKGDLGKALEYGKRQVASFPDEANPWDTLGGIYVLMGQLDLAVQSFTKALSIKPDFYASLAQISYAYGLKENYPEAIKWADECVARSTVASYKLEGYLLKAFYEYWTGSFQKALENAERLRVVGEETQHVDWHSLDLKSRIYCYQKKFDLARDAMTQAYDIFIKELPRFVYLYMAQREADLGWIEIQAGKIDAARKRLITLNRLLSENKNPVQKKVIEGFQIAFKAKLLIAEGSFADAISILEGQRTALRELEALGGFTPLEIYESNFMMSSLKTDLARAYEMKGDVDKAIGVLEQRARFNAAAKDFRLVPPMVYYDLGRLYEQKGLKAKAKDNYAKFLDLWKDADPGLPEVEDARQRLARLKG